MHRLHFAVVAPRVIEVFEADIYFDFEGDGSLAKCGALPKLGSLPKEFFVGEDENTEQLRSEAKDLHSVNFHVLHFLNAWIAKETMMRIARKVRGDDDAGLEKSSGDM